MKRKPIPCPSPSDLRDCLETTSEPNPWLVDHLASCSDCQSTLSFVAGHETWWDEAQQFLTREVDPIASRISSRVCPLTSGEITQSGSDVLLSHELHQLQNLLDKPSHPELLGRIGRYELEQLVGRGGMGLVFRAHDTELHRVVAIKTLALHLIPIGAARERFVRESRACAALTHPHIVPMYDVVHDGAVPALVMQYVAGPTLHAWIREHGAIAWQDALKLGCQLADALDCAHQHGLVHRDIKPGNVLLEANGSRALLTDFGLARVLDAATMTQSGILTGTPEYMSPEQAKGEPVDERSDLFALGSLIYTMLAGYPPFRAAEPMAILQRVCHTPHVPLHRVNAEIPLEVSQLVDRLLAKNPQYRFASANGLRDSMQELLRSPRRLIRYRKFGWLRYVAAIGAATAIVLCIGLSEPMRNGLPVRHEAERNPLNLNRQSEMASSKPSMNAKEIEGTRESASSNATGIFDDFHAIDRELIRLRDETQRVQQGMRGVNDGLRSNTLTLDPFDQEVERLKRDSQRLASEF